MNADTKLLDAAAAFRDLKQTRWLLLIEITAVEEKENELRLALDDLNKRVYEAKERILSLAAGDIPEED